MCKSILKHLLLPLFAGLSFNLSAATTTASLPNEPMPVVTQAQTPSSLLNLNTADALTLQQELTGIGKAKAEAIVAYRDANGPFASVDELLEIKGIGNALLERNRGKLVVE
ncbi:ComEA family DNA-binding protein [Pseudomonas putida]|uniref:ComEA family DNA-binding protein n=1 Tax=Pseudomonas putida TaxID=303 RepID=A0A4D6X5G3_PSEPU|nr:ComEA family DNA-binding protein [Pseudomonas putida]QCI11307.1 ComEA family DNA-binding protein [Pseudomonas putida]